MEPENYDYLTFKDAYNWLNDDKYPENMTITTMKSRQSGKTEYANLCYSEHKPNQEKPFKVGDKVVLKTGVAPQIVNKVMGNKIRCNYLSSRKETSFRPMSDFLPYVENSNTDNISVKTEKEEIMTTKLYKVLSTADGKERYGEWKANDGDKFILMMSDSGAYEAFEKDKLKRVMDFTYDVMFNGTGRVYSYKGDEGAVEVGDILMDEGLAIVKVIAINTESETASKRFKGVKLNTAALS